MSIPRIKKIRKIKMQVYSIGHVCLRNRNSKCFDLWIWLNSEQVKNFTSKGISVIFDNQILEFGLNRECFF